MVKTENEAGCYHLPLYCDGFSHTDGHNKDKIVHYVFSGVTYALPNYYDIFLSVMIVLPKTTM